jgi:bile acid:Na+ symporter, BASS family
MKTLLLLAAITLGILFPFLHSYAFLIKYLLMIMLFFSFLKMDVKLSDILINHFYILLANILIPLVFYFVFLLLGNSLLAQIAFITGIAPTAIASPIIINLLKGKIEFSVISILLTNFVIAFLLPFLIPILLNSTSTISFSDVLIPVSQIFLIPFVLSLILKKYFVSFKNRLVKLNKYVFYFLILNITLGTSNASNYIRAEMGFGDIIIYEIALVSLILCFLSFFIGKLFAPKFLQAEGSQSLGQKNNGFTVWVALTFISPLAVLGPVFYILFQNFYISLQLHRNNKRQD